MEDEYIIAILHRVLSVVLRKWVAHIGRNGIKQHGPGWNDAKMRTIGGSSIATIMGINPFSNIYRLISDKVGITEFPRQIATQWGNLFEDLIKSYVEMDKNCIIHGSDIYVHGPSHLPGTSYSPDGLTVLDLGNGPEITLVEFKCPYSRIPNGTPPKYYVPQVKMGMEILKIPTTGLFIEAVFRRCSWEDLGPSPIYDRALVSKGAGNNTLAYGLIGFYTTANLNFDLIRYNEFFIEPGNNSNDYMCNDLGNCPPQLFREIMDHVDRELIKIHYGPVHKTSDDINTNVTELISSDVSVFTELCKSSNYINIGVLPWKLFRVDYHIIQKEDDYVAPWLEKINEVIGIVDRCNNAEHHNDKIRIFTEYIQSKTGQRFSDEME